MIIANQVMVSGFGYATLTAFLTERPGLVKTTIEYDNDCIEVEVSEEVYEYLEQDRRHQQAQDRSDRRHLSKGTFE